MAVGIAPPKPWHPWVTPLSVDRRQRVGTLKRKTDKAGQTAAGEDGLGGYEPGRYSAHDPSVGHGVYGTVSRYLDYGG